MKLPAWLKSILAASVLATAAWAIQDRLSIGERLATVEAYIRESMRRFDKIDRANERIEQKLDEVIKEKK